MGVSTDAILGYGFDLGGEDGGWKFQEVGEHGELALPWYDAASDEDFQEQAGRRLLEAVNADPDKGTWPERLLEHSGVALVRHGHLQFPQYLLVTKYRLAMRGNPEALTEAWLVADHNDEALSRAFFTLGITPTDPSPGWILASDTDFRVGS